MFSVKKKKKDYMHKIVIFKFVHISFRLGLVIRNLYAVYKYAQTPENFHNPAVKWPFIDCAQFGFLFRKM